jgi:hypothetical protein
MIEVILALAIAAVAGASVAIVVRRIGRAWQMGAPVTGGRNATGAADRDLIPTAPSRLFREPILSASIVH